MTTVQGLNLNSYKVEATSHLSCFGHHTARVQHKVHIVYD